jgi:hypothetical protein
VKPWKTLKFVDICDKEMSLMLYGLKQKVIDEKENNLINCWISVQPPRLGQPFEAR